MPSFRFRLARPTDLPAIMAFVKDVCVSAYRDPALIAHADRQRVFANDELVAVFVAEEGVEQRIVGCITVQRVLLPWTTAVARCTGHLTEPKLDADDEISIGLTRAAIDFA